MNGKEIPAGDQFRYGIEYDVEGKSKLIVYVQVQSTKSTSFEMKQAEFEQILNYEDNCSDIFVIGLHLMFSENERTFAGAKYPIYSG